VNKAKLLNRAVRNVIIFLRRSCGCKLGPNQAPHVLVNIKESFTLLGSL
jgi:hypothetical protein